MSPETSELFLRRDTTEVADVLAMSAALMLVTRSEATLVPAMWVPVTTTGSVDISCAAADWASARLLREGAPRSRADRKDLSRVGFMSSPRMGGFPSESAWLKPVGPPSMFPQMGCDFFVLPFCVAIAAMTLMQYFQRLQFYLSAWR